MPPFYWLKMKYNLSVNLQDNDKSAFGREKQSILRWFGMRMKDFVLLFSLRRYIDMKNRSVIQVYLFTCTQIVATRTSRTYYR